MAAPIPFGNKQATGQEELAGAGQECFNLILESSGALRRRPGLVTAALSADLSDGIDSIYADVDGGVWAISSGVISKLGAVPMTISTSGSTMLKGLNRPVWAETEALLVVAAGDVPQCIEKSSLVSRRLGGDPPKMTHIVAANGRLIGNALNPNQAYSAEFTDLSKIFWSDPAAGLQDYSGHETWAEAAPPNFLSAETRPDPVRAVAANMSELFVFGASTIQVVMPDPSFVYVPVSTIGIGLLEPSSLVSVEEAFAFIDDSRRIVLSSGREVQVLSGDIQNQLDDIDITGAFGYRVREGWIDALVWTFPKDGRTFCYQLGNGWCQWSFDALGAFPVTAHAYLNGSNVVGLKDGVIRELSRQSNVDVVGGESKPILARATTGFIDRGTHRRKKTYSVKLTFRPGAFDLTESNARGTLSWRDEVGDWESVVFDLRDGPVLDFRSIGQAYRIRQWRIEYEGDAEFVLAAANEEFEVLEE